jgi:two-component system, chemotaxis family, protein-glutamate methylesterase/glutaminase
MINMIVLGGSAGALDALTTILPALPPSFAVPVVVVVHMRPDKPSYLAQVLSVHCSLPIKEIEDKEPLSPGVIYVAPPNYHVLVERDGCLSLSVDELVHFSRPSIDVLFESASVAYGSSVLGVLLAGANEDGARGLSSIRGAGGITVVQSPETSQMRAMPEAALRVRADHQVLPVGEIGYFIAEQVAQTMSRKQAP